MTLSLITLSLSAISATAVATDLIIDLVRIICAKNSLHFCVCANSSVWRRKLTLSWDYSLLLYSLNKVQEFGHDWIWLSCSGSSGFISLGDSGCKHTGLSEVRFGKQLGRPDRAINCWSRGSWRSQLLSCHLCGNDKSGVHDKLWWRDWSWSLITIAVGFILTDSSP